jgi:hypothetical protein
LNLVAGIGQVTANGDLVVVASKSGTSPLTFTTSNLLPATYYTVVVSSASGSPSGTFQLSMASNYGGVAGAGGFEGGVVAGGYLAPGIVGYGGFCVPVSQTVNVVQQGQASGYTAGAITVQMTNSAGTVFSPQILDPQSRQAPRFGPPERPKTAAAISPP